MQATDLWYGDDVSGPGALLVERKMSTGALVIVDVRGENAAQMGSLKIMM
jgi:hypothetical protein